MDPEPETNEPPAGRTGAEKAGGGRRKRKTIRGMADFKEERTMRNIKIRLQQLRTLQIKETNKIPKLFKGIKTSFGFIIFYNLSTLG